MSNPLLKLSKKSRLGIAIGISLCFFLVEVSVGFYSKSLALIADAFHVLFDLLSFSLALSALIISERESSKYPSLSFGWQRAQLLGSFFNGVFQLALGFSIFLLSIERFIAIEEIQNPKLVLIVACAGLGSNIVSGSLLGVHEHSHGANAGDLDLELLKKTWCSHEHAHTRDDITKHHHDLGTKAVLIHVLGDAFNNIGVIIAAAIIWKTHFKARFYADPAASMGIGLMLILTALKLVWQGGKILLQSAPLGVDVADVRFDLENVPGVVSVHELHVWRLNEDKACASAHIVIADASLEQFQGIAKIINECLHAYGIHSATIQPEVAASSYQSASDGNDSASLRRRIRGQTGCELHCGSDCEDKSCCG
ncbi:cation efflux protein [Tothia fuscella]|uniref:Cation efflux protein n=1 Tax=Tothia fuscella TaxID=1048955 RepID=A0A9P4NM01_9PEZI|nr:cation efflux protein [Tothia fuscella]